MCGMWHGMKRKMHQPPYLQFVLLRNVGCMVGCKLGHPVLNVGIALGLLYLYCMNEYNILRSTAVNTNNFLYTTE